jgi:hypothetical protein
VFGEEVVLIGAMGDQRIWAEERVPAGGSAYEVTSLLQARLPRIFGLAAEGSEARDAERRARRDAGLLRDRVDEGTVPRSSAKG